MTYVCGDGQLVGVSGIDSYPSLSKWEVGTLFSLKQISQALEVSRV